MPQALALAYVPTFSTAEHRSPLRRLPRRLNRGRISTKKFLEVAVLVLLTIQKILRIYTFVGSIGYSYCKILVLLYVYLVTTPNSILMSLPFVIMAYSNKHPKMFAL